MAGDSENSRLDDAARAGWLYFIAGNTQGEIAKKLNVSRPTAQRLVSLALSARLITFRLEHPIAACMALAKELKERFALMFCDVVPTDSSAPAAISGIAKSAAAFLEHRLRSEAPAIVALGTGRTLRAAVEEIPAMNCPNHQLVSLVGNISPDGSASFYDVLTRMSDLTRAPHYPMPLPLFASSAEERDLFAGLSTVRKVRALAQRADVTLVGVGQIDLDAQILLDGFVSRADLLDFKRNGSIGEIVGWCFDAEGNIVAGPSRDRITSVPLETPAKRLVVGAASGAAKVAAIRAALIGKLLSGLITDEHTAEAVLRA
ncbi:MAG: sugar-binding transcriptional regulator [Pseudomonadota bacterium]|nr:sugar-binding transcriptional regulator [Pseudomonadota bacterium]